MFSPDPNSPCNSLDQVDHKQRLPIATMTEAKMEPSMLPPTPLSSNTCIDFDSPPLFILNSLFDESHLSPLNEANSVEPTDKKPTMVEPTKEVNKLIDDYFKAEDLSIGDTFSDLDLDSPFGSTIKTKSQIPNINLRTSTSPSTSLHSCPDNGQCDLPVFVETNEEPSKHLNLPKQAGILPNTDSFQVCIQQL